MMHLKRLRPWFCTAVAAVGLLEYFYGRSLLLDFSGGIVVLSVFVTIFPLLSLYTRVIVAILGGSSLLAILFAKTTVPIIEVIGGFIEMAPLVALLAAANLVGIPLELGRYAELFQRFYAKAQKPFQPYIISLLISYVLTLFSLAGAVVPSYYLIQKNLRKLGLEQNNRLETSIIVRGYAMALIVSPVAATVGITVKYSGLTWWQMVGPVFLLSLAGLVAAFILETSRPDGKKRLTPHPASKEQDLPNISAHRLYSFLVLFLGVIGGTLYLGNVCHVPSLSSIALGCLLAILIWGLFSRQLSPLLKRSLSFFSHDIIKTADQTALFIAAGFFTYALEAGGVLKIIGSLVEALTDRVDIVVILAAVPLLILLLAVAGLHPFASGIIIAKTLLATPLEFSALGLAIALMGGMSLSFALSPYSILILLLSSLTGKSPYKLGMRWNSSFAAVFWGMTTIFIFFIVRWA